VATLARGARAARRTVGAAQSGGQEREAGLRMSAAVGVVAVLGAGAAPAQASLRHDVTVLLHRISRDVRHLPEGRTRAGARTTAARSAPR
jgi:hypothetical protein